MSLITVLITILGISAQNTYNMVIEMTNGTKINIGPNDIKNMSFMEGNLTVSGESIDDIKKEIAELKKKVDEQKTCECSKEIEALKQEIASLNTSDIITMINDLKMQVQYLTAVVATLKTNGGNNDSQGGGNDDQGGGQGGNQGNVDNPDELVGIWAQYHQEYTTGSYLGYYIGIKLDANGDAAFSEWGNNDTPNWTYTGGATWYVNGGVLTVYAPNGSLAYSSAYELSSDGKTITFEGDTSGGHFDSLKGEFVKL